ncbi:hypothetical protein Bbelb_320820 [Branchiostoma belcheri]|nr:hypothetical protein Bbelb_320820 [Branchiostoma belcheri]
MCRLVVYVAKYVPAVIGSGTETRRSCLLAGGDARTPIDKTRLNPHTLAPRVAGPIPVRVAYTRGHNGGDLFAGASDSWEIGHGGLRERVGEGRRMRSPGRVSVEFALPFVRGIHLFKRWAFCTILTHNTGHRKHNPNHLDALVAVLVHRTKA